MKKLLAFLLVFVLLMASSVSAEQEIKFRDAEWMGGLYDTLSAVFVDDYRIMLPGGERIGDTDASTYVYVFQTSVRTVLGNKDENRKCLLANEFSIDLGEVAGIPLSSINLYFLFDETNPDYVGETEDAIFFMAEYVFDADESAMAELEKKLDYLYASCRKIDVPQDGAINLPDGIRSRMEPMGTAWVNLTGGVELTLYVGKPMVTYWYDYTAFETASDTTGL